MIKKPVVLYLNITIGVILIAIAYYFLYLPQDLVIGGVTGIAIILNELMDEIGFMPSVFIYILNAILLFVGFLVLGKDFLYKTIYGSILLPTIIFLLELSKINPSILFEIDMMFFNIEMNEISQILLSVLLGTLLTGTGLGLCFKNNASTGGMDVVQKIIVKFFHFSYSKTVYITDGIIIIISLLVFGVERTMYSLISIFLVGIIIDYIVMGGAIRRTAFIISNKNEEIKQIIIEKIGRGVTVVPAYGGYSNKEINMLICTLNKSESYLLRDLVLKIDENAFTFFVSAKEVYGDGF